MQHPKLISARYVGLLHLMVQETCENYFSTLDDELTLNIIDGSKEDLEEIFEQDLAAIGKMVLQVHYGDNYLAFIEALKKEAKSDEEG